MPCAKDLTQDSPIGAAGVTVMRRQVRSRNWGIILDQPPETDWKVLLIPVFLCPLLFQGLFKKASRLLRRKTSQYWLGLYQRKRMSGIRCPLLWPWPQIEVLLYTVNRVILLIFFFRKETFTIPHPPIVFTQEFPATRPPVSYPEGNSTWGISPHVKILFCDF